jgi:bifunctional non-homologous end joining protein LigD
MDLRNTPLRQRKDILKKLMAKAQPPIHYSEDFHADGARMFTEACKMNWKGIISKDELATYRSTRMTTG